MTAVVLSIVAVRGSRLADLEARVAVRGLWLEGAQEERIGPRDLRRGPLVVSRDTELVSRGSRIEARGSPVEALATRVVAGGPGGARRDAPSATRGPRSESGVTGETPPGAQGAGRDPRGVTCGTPLMGCGRRRTSGLSGEVRSGPHVLRRAHRSCRRGAMGADAAPSTRKKCCGDNEPVGRFGQRTKRRRSTSLVDADFQSAAPRLPGAQVSEPQESPLAHPFRSLADRCAHPGTTPAGPSAEAEGRPTHERIDLRQRPAAHEVE